MSNCQEEMHFYAKRTFLKMKKNYIKNESDFYEKNIVSIFYLV